MFIRGLRLFVRYNVLSSHGMLDADALILLSILKTKTTRCDVDEDKVSGRTCKFHILLKLAYIIGQCTSITNDFAAA